MEVTKHCGIIGCCENCAHFEDCPTDYFCPAAKILKFLMEEQEKDRLKIIMREDLSEELEDIE